ncbi:hypothetical protein QYF36_003075 [Acer negundo]|nr:hypothetical protein QYF36_003075 [Acer negundo]
MESHVSIMESIIKGVMATSWMSWAHHGMLALVMASWKEGHHGNVMKSHSNFMESQGNIMESHVQVINIFGNIMEINIMEIDMPTSLKVLATWRKFIWDGKATCQVMGHTWAYHGMLTLVMDPWGISREIRANHGCFLEKGGFSNHGNHEDDSWQIMENWGKHGTYIVKERLIFYRVEKFTVSFK